MSSSNHVPTGFAEIVGQIVTNGDQKDTKVTFKLGSSNDSLGAQAVASFAKLYYSSELADVSIVVEGKLMGAHKVVLSMSSSYFRTVFKEVAHLPCAHHPVVILRGVTINEWYKLRRLMYRGSVHVAKAEIASLFAAAGRLKIAVLEGSPLASSTSDGTSQDVHYPPPQSMYGISRGDCESRQSSNYSRDFSGLEMSPGRLRSPPDVMDDELAHSRSRSISTPQTVCGSVPLCLRYSTEEVNAMINAVENFPGNNVPCAICRKYVKRERLRAHINECHLLDGRRILCSLCGMALKSKGSYRVHVWRHRRGALSDKRRRSAL